MTDASAQIPLLSLYSLVGLLWTLLTYYLFFSRQAKAVLANPWLLLVTVTAMVATVKIVTAEMAVLAEMAGGLQALDGRFPYTAADITEFGLALGEEGRRAYAAFQWGSDSLAPPAFACFYLNMIYATIRFPKVRSGLTVVLFIYFNVVLLTNNLMPLVFLNFPSQEGLLGALYNVFPVLDAIKYIAGHITHWAVFVICWLIALVQWIRLRGSS